MRKVRLDFLIKINEDYLGMEHPKITIIKKMKVLDMKQTSDSGEIVRSVCKGKGAPAY